MKLKQLAFNLQYGNFPEANLFIEVHKSLNLPESLLGESIEYDGLPYMFIGLKQKPDIRLSQISSFYNGKYVTNNISLYIAVLLNTYQMTPQLIEKELRKYAIGFDKYTLIHKAIIFMPLKTLKSLLNI